MLKKRKGGTLIFTIVLLVVLSILAVAIISLSFANFKSFSTKNNNFQAKLVAKSGLDLASQYIIDSNSHFKETLGNNEVLNIYYIFNAEDSATGDDLPDNARYLIPEEEYSVDNKIVKLKPSIDITNDVDLEFSGTNGVAIVTVVPDRSHKDQDIAEIRYSITSEGYYNSSSSELSLVLLEGNNDLFADETGIRLFTAGYVLQEVNFVYSDTIGSNENYTLPATRAGVKTYLETKLGLASSNSSAKGSTYEYINNIFPNIISNGTPYQANNDKDLIMVMNNGNYTLNSSSNVFDFGIDPSDPSAVVLDRGLAIIFDGTITLEGYFPPNVKLVLVGIGQNAKVILNDTTNESDFILNAHIIVETVLFGPNSNSFDPEKPDGFPSRFTGAILTANTNVKKANIKSTNYSDPYYFFNMMYATDSSGDHKETVFDFPMSRTNPLLSPLTPADSKQSFTKNEYSE